MTEIPGRKQEQQFELSHTQKIAVTEAELESGEGYFYIAPRSKPEVYPGDKPETSGFLVNGESSLVSAVRWNNDSSTFVNRGEFNPEVDLNDPHSLEGISAMPLEEYLETKGLTPLRDRYVLTAFGSNRSPGQLQHKFRGWIKDQKITDEAATRDMLFVPGFNGILTDYDVVYNSVLGNMGYAFGDLYTGPETQGTEIEVAVLFLTKEQMMAVHDSEKSYDFAEVGQVRMGNSLLDDSTGFSASIEVPAYAHIGSAEVYAAHYGDGRRHPIAIEDIYASDRKLVAMKQPDFQELHLSNDPTGKKLEGLRLAKVLTDLGIEDKDFIEGLDPNNLPPEIAEALANEQLELTAQNYRDWIRIGGKANKLAIRRKFKEIAMDGTTDEEKMIADPSAAPKVTILSKDVSGLPTWGQIKQAQQAA